MSSRYAFHVSPPSSSRSTMFVAFHADHVQGFEFGPTVKPAHPKAEAPVRQREFGKLGSTLQNQSWSASAYASARAVRYGARPPQVVRMSHRSLLPVTRSTT